MHPQYPKQQPQQQQLQQQQRKLNRARSTTMNEIKPYNELLKKLVSIYFWYIFGILFAFTMTSTVLAIAIFKHKAAFSFVFFVVWSPHCHQNGIIQKIA